MMVRFVLAHNGSPGFTLPTQFGLTLFALEDNRVRGPLNGTAPNVVRSRDFAQTLARVVEKPDRMAIPGFLLKMWLGKAADTIIYGCHVLPRKVLDLGYQFCFPALEGALRDLVEK